MSHVVTPRRLNRLAAVSRYYFINGPHRSDWPMYTDKFEPLYITVETRRKWDHVYWVGARLVLEPSRFDIHQGRGTCAIVKAIILRAFTMDWRPVKWNRNFRVEMVISPDPDRTGFFIFSGGAYTLFQ